ncbi:hypothetical protein Fmac_021209 [Flemingia macrophylla]|uniref:Uncharacterized protein n=1 Tax=Flemingia macrophylla TaxID=520843 RepID=A0ABD1LWF9_9FABA
MAFKEEKPMVVIEIFEKLERLPTNVPNCGQVCVCHVPNSLSFLKPEAYIPQIVGLGPYHHSRSELIMTTELKLGVVKRVLKLNPKPNTDLFHQNVNVSDIQPLYHADVHLTSDYPTLLSVFTVDGLFLLALLHSDVRAILKVDRANTFLLTGKPGMPLVNIHGIELSAGSILREVFMIENWIPTRVLKLINRVHIDRNGALESPDKDLGSAMRTFCEALCPFVVSDIDLFKFGEDHDHLLDLMYNLIIYVPESQPELEPDPPTNPFFSDMPRIITSSLSIIIVSIVYNIFFLFRLSYQVIFYLVRYSVHRVIPSIVAAPESIKIIRIFDGLRCIVALAAYNVSRFKVRTRLLSHLLRNFGKKMIKFKPAECGISSGKLQFLSYSASIYLPCIRLNVTSEVIIRNLLAYEALAKPNRLILARHVKLMCALIDTAKDVQLLVDNKIIRTNLSKEVVAQLFNGLSKSVNTCSEKIQGFELQIKNLMATWDMAMNIFIVQKDIIIIIFVLSSFKLLLPFILSVAEAAFCIFDTTTMRCIPLHGWDYVSGHNHQVANATEAQETGTVNDGVFIDDSAAFLCHVPSLDVLYVFLNGSSALFQLKSSTMAQTQPIPFYNNKETDRWGVRRKGERGCEREGR